MGVVTVLALLVGVMSLDVYLLPSLLLHRHLLLLSSGGWEVAVSGRTVADPHGVMAVGPVLLAVPLLWIGVQWMG